MPGFTALAIVLFLVLSSSKAEAPRTETGCAESSTLRESPPPDPAADPFGPGPWFVNADRTIWASHAEPLLAGERGNKVLWIRPRGARLRITGRRLDASAPPFRVSIPGNYEWTFQATGLEFASPGCWQITAFAAGSSLTFTTRVFPATSSVKHN